MKSAIAHVSRVDSPRASCRANFEKGGNVDENGAEADEERQAKMLSVHGAIEEAQRRFPSLAAKRVE